MGGGGQRQGLSAGLEGRARASRQRAAAAAAAAAGGGGSEGGGRSRRRLWGAPLAIQIEHDTPHGLGAAGSGGHVGPCRWLPFFSLQPGGSAAEMTQNKKKGGTAG